MSSKDEKEEIQSLGKVIVRFLEDVMFQCQQYKNDLQASCLLVVVSVPVQLIHPLLAGIPTVVKVHYYTYFYKSYIFMSNPNQCELWHSTFCRFALAKKYSCQWQKFTYLRIVTFNWAFVSCDECYYNLCTIDLYQLIYIYKFENQKCDLILLKNVIHCLYVLNTWFFKESLATVIIKCIQRMAVVQPLPNP